MIALREAAGDKDLPDHPRRFQLPHGEDIVDRLTLGGVNKAAGIDDHNIRTLNGGQNLIARLAEEVHHLLRIDLIFGTAEGDHPDAFAHNSVSFLHSPKNSSSDA